MEIQEFIEKIKSNEVDIVEHTHKVIEECKKINKEYNYFNTISEELALKQASEIKKSIKNNDKNIKNKKLLGVAISVKDAICVKGVESTAGLRILKGYTLRQVIHRIKEGISIMRSNFFFPRFPRREAGESEEGAGEAV
mgnify:CR=1 FL=1